ncbi:MAG: WYL domain-containing protein [Desulfobulbaceae bacterium]|nr:WYL domain-containing protein [Desulfobulbaceae bacterium]
MKNGKNRLTFTASSEPELIAWLLSWGDEAKVMRPDWLVKGIKKKAEGILRKYS